MTGGGVICIFIENKICYAIFSEIIMNNSTCEIIDFISGGKINLKLINNSWGKQRRSDETLA